MEIATHSLVREYYGKRLKHSRDLKTNACCDAARTAPWLTPYLDRVHPRVRERYYGCGLICPPLLQGCRVLDLGCGAGRDVYLLAQWVGAEGEVIGVDMTPEQLAVARRYRAWHAKRFGFENVRFLQGYIEELDALDLEPQSFDVIVSNCVVNLSPDKAAVLQGVWRLLKPGGEFYFSDVYADRRLPQELREDPILYAECLGGALYWNDFYRLARAAGFADPRLVESRPLAVNGSELRARIGNVQFYSATFRLFRIDTLEDACEDYGQAVIYRGTIPEQPTCFVLDQHHRIETGRVFPVCGNTYRMLHDSRLRPHFEFLGDFSKHYGLFPGCGRELFDAPTSAKTGCC